MKYIDQIKALDFPENQFAVFGSGPIAIRNIRENADVDIIVKKELWDKLAKSADVKNEGNKQSIKFDNIEIFNNWRPWFEDVDELIDTADVIDGIRFVQLKHVIVWKKAMGREKDIKDVQMIENYLKK